MKKRIVGLSLAVVLLGGSLMGYVLAQNVKDDGDENEKGEQERQVKEAEVPKAALDALKKLAGGAAFTAFAEEIEHGHTFYEGSWNGPNGNVDALVTTSGDVVEIEEVVPPGQVPSSAQAATQKAWGADPKLTWEKKTLIMYEAHFMKGEQEHEMILTPDGRQFHEQGAMGADDDDDEDDDEDEEDEDDEKDDNDKKDKR